MPPQLGTPAPTDATARPPYGLETYQTPTERETTNLLASIMDGDESVDAKGSGHKDIRITSGYGLFAHTTIEVTEIIEDDGATPPCTRVKTTVFKVDGLGTASASASIVSFTRFSGSTSPETPTPVTINLLELLKSLNVINGQGRIGVIKRAIRATLTSFNLSARAQAETVRNFPYDFTDQLPPSQ
jgi:hypothetical protein